MRPDVRKEGSPNFLKVALNEVTLRFTQRVALLKIAQEVARHLGYICTKTCHQGDSKIVKSGHGELD